MADVARLVRNRDEVLKEGVRETTTAIGNGFKTLIYRLIKEARVGRAMVQRADQFKSEAVVQAMYNGFPVPFNR